MQSLHFILYHIFNSLLSGWLIYGNFTCLEITSENSQTSPFERNGFWTAENAFHRFSKISSVSPQISFVQHINQL